jgi:hypothetical protein
MRKSTGKATQRPPKPRGLSPVIAGRVPTSLHRQIKEAAKKSGRSMSEEMAWRVAVSFEWEKVFGDARKVLTDAERVSAGTLRQAMRTAGFTPVYGSAGTYWLEPGMPTVPLEASLAPEVRAAITEAVKQAFAEAREGGS